MKRFLLSSFLIIGIIGISASNLIGQTTPLYITFLTHNENGDYCPNARYVAGCGYEDAATFATLRRNTKLLADTIRVKGAKWNFQSDWTFIVGVFKHDRGDASTGGKNLLRWFAEDNNKQIELDPHSHEDFGYNYADVVKLLDSAGANPTRIVGGFTYNTRMNDRRVGQECLKGRTWDSLGRGLAGTKYPTYRTTFTTLWGGSFGKEVDGCVQTGHTNDVSTLGIWHPKGASDTDFFIHDPKQPMAFISKGYGISIDSTTNPINAVNAVVAILDSLRTGRIPGGKMYVLDIDVHQKYFKSDGYPAKIGQVIEALKPYVQQGRLIWATFTEKLNIWRTTYNSAPHLHPYPFKTTSVVAKGASTIEDKNEFHISPNPAQDLITVKLRLSKSERVSLKIYNTLGQEVAQILDETLSTGAHEQSFDMSHWSLGQGIYFLQLKTQQLSPKTIPLQVLR